MLFSNLKTMSTKSILILIGSLKHQKNHFGSYHLLKAFSNLGHKTVLCEENNLQIDIKGSVNCIARLYQSKKQLPHWDWDQLKKVERYSINEFDLILLRNNPISRLQSGEPYYQNWIHQIIYFHKDNKIINNPSALILAYQKSHIWFIPECYRPKTIITRNSNEAMDQIRSLKECSNEIVIKPATGSGGKNVKKFKFDQIEKYEIHNCMESGYIIIQEYIPAKYEKRILIVNGHILKSEGQVAVYKRCPTSNEWRHNLSAGAKPEPTELTNSEKTMLCDLGPILDKAGFHFVALDFYEQKVIDINVFCPGGLDTLKKVYHISFSESCAKELIR